MPGLLDRPASETQVTHRQRVWLYAVAALVMVFLVAPTLIVVPMSFSDSQYLEFPPRKWSLRWYETYFTSREWMAATRTSFAAAVLTMLLATPLGTLAAYGLHGSELRLGRVVFTLLIMPMMVPLILVAVGAFYVYVRLGLVHMLAGLVLAHSVLALPLVLIVVSAGLKSYDMNHELAARSLGAARWRALLTITLPQIRFSVITTALLAFLTSFDEVVVALFISGGENGTLTRASNGLAAVRGDLGRHETSGACAPMAMAAALGKGLDGPIGRARKPRLGAACGCRRPLAGAWCRPVGA